MVEKTEKLLVVKELPSVATRKVEGEDGNTYNLVTQEEAILEILETVREFMLILLVLAVIGFAIVIALATLDNTNVLTAGSYEANQTTNILRNVSGGVSEFFDDTGTWLTLLSVVVIILIIAVVILAVNRFSGGTRGL